MGRRFRVLLGDGDRLPSRGRLRLGLGSAEQVERVEREVCRPKPLPDLSRGQLGRRPRGLGLHGSTPQVPRAHRRSNERGQPQDGFLRLTDIYNMRLDADLVVLSACQTALGRQLRGEGLIGLTRGFMYAGAPRVVASLWQVNDAATAELMKKFYRGILTRGLPPAKALHEAQLEMSRESRWQSPYYWAGFVLQGDWQ